MAQEIIEQESSEHALAREFQSGNRAHGVQLIGQCARTWLKAGEVGSLWRWAAQLSRDEILDNDAIATSFIASLIFRRRFAEATGWLHEAQCSARPQSLQVHARLKTLRLMLAVLADTADEDALFAEVGQGPCDGYLSGTLIALQAYALLKKSRFDAAKRRALRAMDLLAEHNDSYGASYAGVLVILTQRLSGDLAGSAQTCERLFASVNQGSRNPAWVNAASALAHLRYEQNRCGEARALYQELLPLLPIASTPENLASVYTTLARLEADAGRPDEAMRLLEYLHSVMEDGRHTRLIALAVYERVRLALLAGDAELAQRIATEASIESLACVRTWDESRPYEPGWERLGQTHVMLLQHARRIDECRQALQSLIKSAVQAGCIVRVVALEALLASCEWQAGDKARAFAALNRALARTRIVGFTRSVFDEAPEFARVLQHAIAERKLTYALPANYSERWASILDAHRLDCPRLDARVEPLTDRERELLMLVAAGLRNEEISLRSGIALSTTKWHMKNIFAKLGVACRTEALVRARQLNLIR